MIAKGMIGVAKLDREDRLRNVAILIFDGLMTDGAHHKQYYLEEALRALCGNKEVDYKKEEMQWEDGIPA